jgi:hypothetical protein
VAPKDDRGCDHTDASENQKRDLEDPVVRVLALVGQTAASGTSMKNALITSPITLRIATAPSTCRQSFLVPFRRPR